MLDDPDNTAGWFGSLPLAQWQGLVVVDGVIEALTLPAAGLDGPLSSELGKLAHLVILDLGGNRLRGPIPPELGRLVKLEALLLHNNRLSGSVPTELGSLTHLKVLELSGNELGGPVPPELGRLLGLEGLFLHRNRLSGSIPGELGALAKLERLYLHGNRLSGPIPPELGRLTALLSLDLSMNHLSGPVPPELGLLTGLETLRIHGNRLSRSDASGPFSTEPLVPEPPATAERPDGSLQPGRFSDDDGSVHEANIEVIAGLGVTVGCNPPENDRYCPHAVVTRAQMMAFLSRALGEIGEVEGAGVRASDLPVDAWYFDDVQRMISLGVAGLQEDGTFRPLDPLTRLEMATLLVRAFPALAEVAEPVGTFSDVPARWNQAGAVEAILEAGVTAGCSTEPLSYCPHDPVTRDQMASFLVRALRRPFEGSEALSLPGAGVRVGMALAGWPSGFFQAALYRAWLQELGYEAGKPGRYRTGARCRLPGNGRRTGRFLGRRLVSGSRRLAGPPHRGWFHGP